MKHKLAKELITEMVEMNQELNDLLLKIEKESDHKEFEFYKKGFSQISGSILLDVINPLLKEHPNLKPKELD